MKTFAEKLNELFETRRKVDGTPYTIEDVLQGTNGVISRVYLWKLRAGRTKNPGFKTLKVLAEFFGVDLNYFDDENTNPVERDEFADYLASVSQRSKSFTKADREMALYMLDAIARAKQSRDTPNRSEDNEGAVESGEDPQAT